jgi:hypothetical protein
MNLVKTEGGGGGVEFGENKKQKYERNTYVGKILSNP